MSGIAPQQNAFKFKFAAHKQKSIVKIYKYNDKSGTVWLEQLDKTEAKST